MPTGAVAEVRTFVSLLRNKTYTVQSSLLRPKLLNLLVQVHMDQHHRIRSKKRSGIWMRPTTNLPLTSSIHSSPPLLPPHYTLPCPHSVLLIQSSPPCQPVCLSGSSGGPTLLTLLSIEHSLQAADVGTPEGQGWIPGDNCGGVPWPEIRSIDKVKRKLYQPIVLLIRNITCRPILVQERRGYENSYAQVQKPVCLIWVYILP